MLKSDKNFNPLWCEFQSINKDDINILKLLKSLDSTKQKYSSTNINTIINQTKIFTENLVKQCPYCSRDNYIKHGKYKDIQRYKCKDCKKTFSQATNSSFKYLKHSPQTIFEFIKMTIEKHTLAYCSQKLKINIATAFFWRHKIFHFEENNTSIQKLRKDIIFLDLISTPISYKGSKNIILEKYQSTCHSPSVTGRDIFTSFLCDKNNSIHIRTLGTIYTWRDTFKEKIQKLIDKDTYLKIKKSRLLNSIVFYHNKKISYKRKKQVQFNCNSSLKDNIKFNEEFNTFYLYFKKWMICFNGVASKYINHYISFCGYNFINKYISKIINCVYIFYEMTKYNHFISIKNLKKLHCCY